MALIDNIVSYWKLDESSGDAADSAGSNTLTNTNTVTYAAGKINNAANFASASSQYFTIADASQTGLDGMADVSFSFWINFASLPTDGNYMIPLAKWNATGNQRSYEVVVRNTSGQYTLEIFYSDDGLGGASANVATANVSLSTSTWYYFVITIAGSSETMTLYKDGSSLTLASNSQNGNTSIYDSTSAFEVGRGTSDLGYVNGAIDELGIWDRVLSASEVTSLYNSGAGNQYPFTVASSVHNLTTTGAGT